MILYSPSEEGVAWLDGLDTSWGRYAGAVYAAAVKRREAGTEDEGAT